MPDRGQHSDTNDHRMNRRRFLFRTCATALSAAAVTACSDRPASSAAPAAAAAQKPAPKDAYDLAAGASGFTVGPMMAANTVYVFFDPTCPHCAAL